MLGEVSFFILFVAPVFPLEDDSVKVHEVELFRVKLFEHL